MSKFAISKLLSIFLLATLVACTQSMVVRPTSNPPPGGVDSGLIVSSFGDFHIIEVTPGEFQGAVGEAGPYDEELKKLEDRIDELREKRGKEGLSNEEKKELDDLIRQMQAILDAMSIFDTIDDILGDIFDPMQLPDDFPGGVGNWFRMELGKRGIGLVVVYNLVGIDIYSGRSFYNVWYYHQPNNRNMNTGNYCEHGLFPLAVKYDTNQLICSGYHRLSM